MWCSTSLFLRRAISASLLLGALVLAVGLVEPVQAQPQRYQIDARSTAGTQLSEIDWEDCGLRKGDIDASLSIRPEALAKRSRTANIEVNYSGFTAEARSAFERAVAIWETHIESDVTIRVDASYESLRENVLGAAGPNPDIVGLLDTDEDGNTETFVWSALFDALSGEDQLPGESDIVVRMNSSRDDWHFGEDDAPVDETDFTSVVVHEIAHGLGYLELTDVSGGEGQYGVDFNENGDQTPSIYALFLAQNQADGSIVSLMNENEFPNPSERLADALTSDRIVFDGMEASVTAAQNPGPVPPKLYAPLDFSRGSSIAHLDETTYSIEGPNELMTPVYNGTVRLPGPILCGQLRDMLWPLGSGCRRYFADVFALQFAEDPDPARGRVTLDWTVREDTTINEFVVEKKAFDGAFEPVKQVSSSPVTIDSLGLGIFTFRVRWTKSDGSEATTPTTVQAEFRTRDVTSEVAGRDDQGRAAVELSWDVPPGTEGFTYQIEQRAGASGEFTEVGPSVNQREFTLPRQTPGAYTYRVSASDGDNTVEGKQTADVNISFDGDVYALGPYPNPVRNTATLDLTARTEQSVTVEAYDVTGRRVYSETRRVGTRAPEAVMLSTRGWSSGMYFLRVRGDEFTETRKMVVVK